MKKNEIKCDNSKVMSIRLGEEILRFVVLKFMQKNQFWTVSICSSEPWFCCAGVVCQHWTFSEPVEQRCIQEVGGCLI